MEGVGARLGRSSTRYGPATVFSGPVRKWKKRWVHVSPSNNHNNNNHSNQNHHHHHTNNNVNNVVNGSTANGNNGSHLLLFKWTPLTQRDGSNNNSNVNGNSSTSNGEKSSAKDDATPEEPPRRKFKYIPVFFMLIFCGSNVAGFEALFGRLPDYKALRPFRTEYDVQVEGHEIALSLCHASKLGLVKTVVVCSLSKTFVVFVFGFLFPSDLCAPWMHDDLGCLTMQIAVLEEQKQALENEAAEIPDNEAKPADTDPNTVEPTPRTDGFDEKPDINDVPMEENQDDGQIVRQDLNESTLDLSLGLTAHDGDSDSKTDQTRDGKLERLNSSR
ncbi:hypothetical protein JRO89_XS06G0154000 [Xanthoceras sorbifolium]|uniref:Uncharacterized protein n=1 Tax=Xanthoceras sorbifolium TaxID=99658 RepID=A0ABQ8HYE7_9ROSI|nr:hypothetical protein JRO89_XS06G0154000 [Xanthoceras sorbifolium]